MGAAGDPFELLPVTAVNRPALARIDYAADDLGELLARLQQRLPEALPGWHADAAAEGGDPVALLAELFAQVAATLSLYADQRANEGWLRTATQHRALIDLCTLIDVRPGAGASATALQAFLAKPGAGGALAAGFKVNGRSSDAREQVFETLAALDVQEARNQMRVLGWNRSSRLLLLRSGATEVQDVEALLDAIYPGLKAGVPIVFDDGATLAAAPLAAADEVDGASRVRWAAGASAVTRDLALADLVLHGRPKQTLRLAVADAADEIVLGANLLPVANQAMFTVGGAVLVVSGALQMPALVLSKTPLAGAAPAGDIVISRSVVAALRRSATRVLEGTACGSTVFTMPAGSTALFRDPLDKKKDFPHTPAPGDLLIAADASGVELLTVASTDGFAIRLTQPLLRALRPIETPFDTTARVRYYMVQPANPATHQSLLRPLLLEQLAGVFVGGETVLALDKAADGLSPETVVAWRAGTDCGAARVAGVDSIDGKTVLHLQGSLPGSLRAAELALFGPFEHQMHVAGWNRSEATLAAGATQLDIDGQPAGLAAGLDLIAADGLAAEGARITQVALDGANTRISLARPLEQAYTLADLVVYGNVAAISHGVSGTDEVLGSGDPAAAPQRFSIRRQPLAWLPDAAAPRGVAPALEVWIGAERWMRVDTLAGSGPLDRHYTVEIDDQDRASIVFGDGRQGQAVPSGRNNVVARYRSGRGTAANLPARAITTMPQPAPFIASTVNLLPASGGAERDSPADIRKQAGWRVRTLDRAVSLADHAELALTVAGIAKTRADLEREGTGAAARQVIVVTTAASGGNTLSTPQQEGLLAYLAARSVAPAKLRVRSHRAWPVRLALQLTLLPSFSRAALQRELLDRFGAQRDDALFHFDRRELGAALTLSEVYAQAEASNGVDHALATLFHAESEAASVADRIVVPADALASGGDAVDAATGRLTLTLVGGLP